MLVITSFYSERKLLQRENEMKKHTRTYMYILKGPKVCTKLYKNLFWDFKQALFSAFLNCSYLQLPGLISIVVVVSLTVGLLNLIFY